MLRKNYLKIILFIFAPYFVWCQQVASPQNQDKFSENVQPKSTDQDTIASGFAIFDQSKFYIENKVFVKNGQFSIDQKIVKLPSKAVCKHIEKPVIGVVIETPTTVDTTFDFGITDIKQDSIFPKHLVKPISINEYKKQLKEKVVETEVRQASKQYSQGGSSQTLDGFWSFDGFGGSLPNAPYKFEEFEIKKFNTTGNFLLASRVLLSKKLQLKSKLCVIQTDCPCNLIFSYYYASRPPPTV